MRVLAMEEIMYVAGGTDPTPQAPEADNSFETTVSVLGTISVTASSQQGLVDGLMAGIRASIQVFTGVVEVTVNGINHIFSNGWTEFLNFVSTGSTAGQHTTTYTCFKNNGNPVCIKG